MQGFQTHTAIQPISIHPLQTQQKLRVTKVQHNAEKHSLFNSAVNYLYAKKSARCSWVLVVTELVEIIGNIIHFRNTYLQWQCIS